jgi:hypothetical protein
MDYEKEMTIDDSALDIECIDQAKLMLKVTRLDAELSRDADNAKETRDFVRAEVDKDIRTNPGKFGLEKTTEAAIQSIILGDERYKKANQAFIDALFESNCAKGAVRACDHRKSMLETLSRLHAQSYFAGPKTPHNLSEVRAERDKKTEAGIGNSFRRTK